MKIFNPATGEVLKEVLEDDAGSISKKYESLRDGQKIWRERPIDERIACVKKFSDLLEKNKEDLSRTLTSEVGKPLQESRNEIAGAVYRIQFFLQNSKKHLAAEQVNENSGTREVLAFEPLGVIANISAWNYPYLIAMNVIVPALIAGNAILYKPSEFSTLSGLEMQRLLFEAGVPESVFQAVVGEGGAGRALLNLPLNGYFFTGSHATGKAIAVALAGRLVPVVLELGGKDPLYVMDDVADVAKAAANAVEGAFYNAGQSCCAVERIYVQEKIYEPFVKAFVEETKKLTLGPVTRSQQIQTLSRQVKDALDHGAKLLTGGKPVGGKGNFFEPTVLVDVNHSMSVMKEETFGPVIGIQKVADDDEALKLMADTEYGLTAAVFSKSEERAKAILQKLDVGTGYWNCCDRVSPWLPWSGRKNSGLGATLSYLGIHAFVKPKGYHLRVK